MTYTSDRPITVDGVRLDTLAWNITRISRAVAARRSADVDVPGVDGVLPSLNDTLEPALFGLDMFVRGTNEDGTVPANPGARTTFRNNLDELVHLFGKRHTLLDVRETVAVGVERRAWAKVQDAITPEVNESGSVGTFTIGMVLPYGVWEDVDTQDWFGPTGATQTAQAIPTLTGASERIMDALFLVYGPVTNPRLTDPATGAYVQFSGVVPDGSQWRVNVATWTSRTMNVGSGWATDTTGTDVQAATTHGGTVGQAAFLPLVPTRNGGSRIVQVALSGSGMGAATKVCVRARRKYAL